MDLLVGAPFPPTKMSVGNKKCPCCVMRTKYHNGGFTGLPKIRDSSSPQQPTSHHGHEGI